MQQCLRLTILSGAILIILLASGCGNKGALYIPESPAEPQSAPESGQ
ncbi:MAG: lipoprotein [Porticoccaceae bacterium]